MKRSPLNRKRVSESSPADLLERVITSVPVDSTAARVTSKGISYECPASTNGRYWDECPQLLPPPLKGIIGIVFGRLTVVGYFGGSKKRGAVWVVRCACGGFETRRSKAIKNPANHGDRCYKCRHLAFNKRQRMFFNTGVELDRREI